MKQLLNKLLPDDDKKRKWLAIFLTVIIAAAFSLWGIYVNQEYGLALFIIVPLFIGASPVILYGFKKKLHLTDAFGVSFLTLGIFTLLLILCAVEGLICIIMAAPIGVLFMMIGSLIAYFIIRKAPGKAEVSILLLITAMPTVSFIERNSEPILTSVVTSIEIDADPETVWKNVIEFPQLKEPTEFIFKTGIAYPTDAKIEGTGVGAVRHCNFTTGSFVEPITVWEQPTLLKFDVLEQPAPMKELSFWNIDAPHLHDFFVSKQGQFKLTKLANGKTLLEGTTWYRHDIKPEFYWRLWSNHIVHKIHQRVLNHIKVNSEKDEKR